MFVDTPTALLMTTVLVAALHICFDTLAFKNDVAFWRAKTSMDGMSAKLAALPISTVSLSSSIDPAQSYRNCQNADLARALVYRRDGVSVRDAHDGARTAARRCSGGRRVLEGRQGVQGALR